MLYQLSYSRGWWGRVDSNHCRQMPTGLQPVSFSHSDTPPNYNNNKEQPSKSLLKEAPDGTRTHDRLITNQVLYQLSYRGLHLFINKVQMYLSHKDFFVKGSRFFLERIASNDHVPIFFRFCINIIPFQTKPFPTRLESQIFSL